MIPRVTRKGLSLRLLLAFVYSSLLAAVFVVIGAFVFARLQRTMLALVDRSLETALNQAMEDIDYINGNPSFSADDEESDEEEVDHGSAYRSSGPVIRIVSSDGSVQSGLGDYETLPLWPVASAGFSTQRANTDQWRISSKPLRVPAGRAAVWLQAAQSLSFLQETLGGMVSFFLIGFPALLFVSATAAFFLSAGALRPLVVIARTAASVDEGDLSRRMGYRGSITEVAGLATSSDRMLERMPPWREFHEIRFGRRRFSPSRAHSSTSA
jgi:HAMP domain-containing protein